MNIDNHDLKSQGALVWLRKYQKSRKRFIIYLKDKKKILVLSMFHMLRSLNLVVNDKEKVNGEIIIFFGIIQELYRFFQNYQIFGKFWKKTFIPSEMRKLHSLFEIYNTHSIRSKLVPNWIFKNFFSIMARLINYCYFNE